MLLLVMSPVPISSLRKSNSDPLTLRYAFKSNISHFYETLTAYLCATDRSSVAAIRDFNGSNISTIPDQLVVRSVDLQTGHTFPVVIALHFLHANSLATYLLPPPFLVVAGAGGCFAFFISCSIHSVAPRNGCLHVIPIFPIAAPLPRLTAVTLARILVPILSDFALWL